jgi:hypothetical protein
MMVINEHHMEISKSSKAKDEKDLINPYPEIIDQRIDDEKSTKKPVYVVGVIGTVLPNEYDQVNDPYDPDIDPDHAPLDSRFIFIHDVRI